MKKRFGKKALSDVISTLLILLLVFVAVAILWVVIRNVINQGSEQVTLGKFTLDLKIDQVSVDETANQVSVRVKRNTGDGEFVGLKIIVSDDENSDIFNFNGSLDVYEKQEFNFNLVQVNSSNIKKIQVAPIFRLSSGKEVVGDVKDTWESSEGISNFDDDEEIILPEENQTGGECTVDSNCTADYYSPNYCHASGDVYRNYFDFYCNATQQCTYTTAPQIVQDCNSTQTCSGAVCVNNAVTPTCTTHNYTQCYNGDVYWYNSCNVREGINDDCSATETCTNNQCVTQSSGAAESLLLAGVPLIHDQTFLIPESAVNGDTVGDLNLMWISPGQNIQFTLQNNDGGRFSIQKLTGRNTVSNHNLNYEIRISVANANFDYDSQNQRQITIRATDSSTGKYNDAVITIKLSKSENTIYIDPAYSGTETGSRTQPYNSWRDVTGSNNEGLIPGYTYLQKRGTTTYDRMTTYTTGTSSQHISLGSYGSGERPVFDGSHDSNIWSTGMYLGGSTSSSATNKKPVAYYDVYSFAYTGGYAGIITGSLGSNHINFYDLYFHNIREHGIYMLSDYSDGTHGDVDMLYHKIFDTVSEHIEGTGTDAYGFKTEAAGTEFRYTVVRFNEKMGFSGASGCSGMTISYSQAYDSNWGIKAHGDNIIVDHTLIQDNEKTGIYLGNFYQLNYKLSNVNFHMKNSLVKNNYEGILISEDAKNALIENTEFSGNTYKAIGFYRNGGFNGAPENFIIKNSKFHDNAVGIYIGNGQSPYPKNITIAYNLFYDNTANPITVSDGTDIKVYNNVFYNNAGSYDVQVSRNELFTARNNLLEDGISATTHANHIVSNNINHQSSFFVNTGSRNFHLNSGVSAINSGVNVGFTKDYDGKTISGNPDAGAFEF
jgi:hypothetical protein